MTRKQFLRSSVSGALAIAALFTAAQAQAQAQAQTTPANRAARSAADAAAPGEVSEVVVTGTLLHGVAPVGTDLITVGHEQIVATGAVSAGDLLATIPQIGFFGTMPRGNQDAGSPLVTPNLRNLGLPGDSTTLILMDGHRIVGAGVLQTFPDPSIIPPAVIERVEVIPGGGSSIYGSDAIGGVINFVTRRKFDGFEATGHYGVADGYSTTDANLTYGRAWSGGSAMISYAYAWHDNLLGADRDYATSNHTSKGGSDLRNTACTPGNITVGTTTYALPGRVAGTLNRCDDQKAVDIYPDETRHSVFGSVNQQLTSQLQFNATAYWSQRNTTVRTVQSSQSGAITAANPYFRPIGAETSQTVAFSYAGVFGPSNVTPQQFQSYGATASLIYDVTNRWQVRALANVGRSFNEIHEDLVNAAAGSLALGGTTTATALNPYDLAATNPAVLATIADFENLALASQRMAQFQVVADGALLTLPGGDVRLAVGAERLYQNLKQQLRSGPRSATGPVPGSFASRTANAVFAEVLVPLVGPENGLPGLRGLDISASVRRDEYNDVGTTTNPKVGFNYKPVEDLTFRANYGTSFHAPDLPTTSSTISSQVQILQVSPFRPVGSPITDLFRPTIVIAGGNPNLRPETAKTWQAGFDWRPRAIEGLALSATWYRVNMTDVIGLVSPTTLFTDPNFAPFFIINPTLAQAKAAVGNLPIVGAPSIESLYVGRSPFLLADARLNNFGAIHQNGIDFDVSYTRAIGSGLYNAAIVGTYTLDKELASGAAGPFTDTLKNGTGKFFYVASVGGKLGAFTAQARLNYRGGYPILGLVGQNRVDAFKTVDLFVAYDLPDHGPLTNTMLTLNVDNLLDEDPPYANTNIGYANGSTLGRLVSVGLRARF
jgi:iron complex outermembrane receptor protein